MIHDFIGYISFIVIIKYWLYFPVLYSISLLVYFMLLTPSF